MSRTLALPTAWPDRGRMTCMRLPERWLVLDSARCCTRHREHRERQILFLLCNRRTLPTSRRGRAVRDPGHTLCTKRLPIRILFLSHKIYRRRPGQRSVTDIFPRRMTCNPEQNPHMQALRRKMCNRFAPPLTRVFLRDILCTPIPKLRQFCPTMSLSRTVCTPSTETNPASASTCRSHKVSTQSCQSPPEIYRHRTSGILRSFADEWCPRDNDCTIHWMKRTIVPRDTPRSHPRCRGDLCSTTLPSKSLVGTLCIQTTRGRRHNLRWGNSDIRPKTWQTCRDCMPCMFSPLHRVRSIRWDTSCKILPRLRRSQRYSPNNLRQSRAPQPSRARAGVSACRLHTRCTTRWASTRWPARCRPCKLGTARRWKEKTSLLRKRHIEMPPHFRGLEAISQAGTRCKLSSQCLVGTNLFRRDRKHRRRLGRRSPVCTIRSHPRCPDPTDYRFQEDTSRLRTEGSQTDAIQLGTFQAHTIHRRRRQDQKKCLADNPGSHAPSRAAAPGRPR